MAADQDVYGPALPSCADVDAADAAAVASPGDTAAKVASTATWNAHHCPGYGQMPQLAAEAEAE